MLASTDLEATGPSGRACARHNEGTRSQGTDNGLQNSLTDNFSRKLTRYIGGLTQPAHIQGTDEIDGDPQFAALCAYLSSHRDMTAEDAIIDVGCGRGVVPHAMTLIEWAAGVPIYVAVDLEEPLRMLSLPPAIHNNSRKILYQDFIGGKTALGRSTNVIVLKNLLHELNIDETAELFSTLNKWAPEDTEIYIQDMQQLPSAESRNAPWSRDRLIELLRILRMEPTNDKVLLSKSGTPWFTIYCRPDRSVQDVDYIGGHICDIRSKMSEDLLGEIDHLNENDPDYPEMNLILARERATIDVQVADWSKKHPGVKGSQKKEKDQAGEVRFGSSPIVLKGAGHGLASRINDTTDDPSVFDVMGILRSKDAIRMAESINNATARVWFFGYSNKHAFFDDSNVVAIAESTKRGTDIRILLVDPRSNAARARAEHPAYAYQADLESDIIQSLRRALELNAEYEGWAPVRVTPTAPPCSYFIIDDYCVASFYTAHSTGTSGQSFVLRNTGTTGDFYSLLTNEFLVAYERAVDGSTVLSRDEVI